MSAISPNMQPLKAIRTYLQAANVAAANTTEAFARSPNSSIRSTINRGP